MKITVINGPNLNNLGKRDSGLYGNLTLDNINNYLKSAFSEDSFDFFQSNIEGEIVNKVQSASDTTDGIIINPAGYAHTSVAIRDALEDLKVPKIEVHLSNLSGRESFRQTLLTASVCNGYISGFKEKGYYVAIILLKQIMEEKRGRI